MASWDGLGVLRVDVQYELANVRGLLLYDEVMTKQLDMYAASLCTTRGWTHLYIGV